MRAAIEQAVLFTKPLCKSSGEFARYELRQGDYKFRLDDGDPGLESTILEDSSGRSLLHLGGDARCREIKLPAGAYTLRMTRSPLIADARAIFANSYPLRREGRGPAVSADFTSRPYGSNGPCGAQTADGSNQNWASRIDISSQASYLANSSYTPAAANPVCTNINTDW